MATSGLYGNSSESIGLYGNTNVFGGTYFQWFIFQQNNDQPVTPTGGTWDFTTNTGTPPTGWTTVVASVAVNPVWFSTGFVDSRNPTVIVWSVPSLLTSSNSIYATAYAQTFTGNGTQTAFTLSSSPVTVNNTDVSINGVVQIPGVDYTVNSVTLTTTTPVINGAVMLVKYKQSLPNSYYGAASNVQFTPVGALTSTNVQSAIAEVVTDLALSSGSSTVGYLPAGTGAVATTVQTKLRESVSVLDFGADPTGVANSSTAINSAIVAAAGKCIYIPSGVYKCNSPILFQTSNTELIGDGASTVLWGNHTGIALEVSPTSGLLSSVTISQLVCWSPTGAGFQASQTINSNFADLWAYSSKIGFTLVNQVQGCTFDRLIFSSNVASAFIARYPVLPAVTSTGAGIFLSNASTVCNANVFNAPIVEGAGSHGISIWGINVGITLINPLSEGNAGYGYTFEGLAGTASALKVIGAYAEANTLGAAYIQGQSLMSLENCWFGAAAGSTVTMVLVSNSSITNSICYSATEDATSVANIYSNFSFITTFSRLGWRYKLTPSNSTSPYIQNFGTQFVTNNTGPTTLAGFSGNLYIGQTITVYINDVNTTVNFTTATFKGNSHVNWSPIIGDWMTCTYNGTYWLCSVNNT